jgi:protein involved in polysaccharide export with SLBB domain
MNLQRKIDFFLLSICAAALCAACSGNTRATSEPRSQQRLSSGLDKVRPAHLQSSDSENNKLRALWVTRTAHNDNSDFSPFLLGPGDVIRVSVQSIAHLRDKTVRISEASSISLPLLGDISVQGMTEEELRAELTHRLKKYMYNPQLEMFVQQTENRQVAVLGSIAKPGRYTLTSRDDTLMTMLGRAGGMTRDAASRIILVPGTAAGSSTSSSRSDGEPKFGNTADEPGRAGAMASTPFAQLAMADVPTLNQPVHHAVTDQVTISLSHPSDERYLEMPAWPGDTIIVPPAGDVTVQGWVDKPGVFPITHGMTAMGAIAAAGGALFTSSATLLRDEDNGTKISIPLDLSRLKDGRQQDVPLEGGDVVIVERSVAGALPYSAYFLVQKIGLGIPLY